MDCSASGGKMSEKKEESLFSEGDIRALLEGGGFVEADPLPEEVACAQEAEQAAVAANEAKKLHGPSKSTAA